MTYSQRVAKALLDIHAVTLSPDKPYTWASGLKAPIYTDNRLTISYPDVRQAIYNGMEEQINLHFADARHGRDSPRGLGCPGDGPADGLRSVEAEGPRPGTPG